MLDHRLAHEYPIGAEAFITLAASVGLFHDDCGKRDPGSLTPYRISLDGLMKRDYIIRHARETDLDRLCQLEELCWQHTRTSMEQIRSRLETYPQGQFVLEKDGEVLGVIYSQRIATTDALMTRTAADVHKLHDESGPIIQPLAVNVDPRAQNAGYGDQLLEFLLQRCSLMTGVQQVAAVTLCKNYDSAGSQPFEDYIRQQGSGQDPVLAFHVAHGAQVVKTVPGYRPQDHANLTNGVLVAYDILNRPLRHQRLEAAGTLGPTADAVAMTFDARQIAEFVQSEAAQLLGIGEDELDIDRPVMEMGLDSADLLKLQQMCEQRFGLHLQAGFFFEHSTIRKVVDHMAISLAVPSEEASVAQLGSHTSAARPPADTVFPERDDSVAMGSIATTDIAIVGMSCKLPGGIETPDQLWRVLASSECVIGPFPRNRRSWPTNTEYPAIDQGGFVDDVDSFDAAFFRMSPAEAQITDPQQRMLLELAWGCLEDAGILPSTLKGSDTGVFIGASNADYSRLINEAGVEIEAHHGVGSSLAILANRISYFFDLSGPSLVVDTACSSSLVAVHSAVQSLRSGECETALVGGVNLICHPDLSIAYHKAGMLAHDGRCKAFDAKADGYVRSEGAVVLLLKPLHAAIADRNEIHAVIRGSAINHGGLAGGLTVPNPQKQKELLLKAWKDAGIAARELTYIEAHGTGTSLGDPIEIQGIQAAYSELESDEPAQPCAIGSVKSNLGHLESAAGITGLLKVILSFKHQQIPASINFSELNPKIRLTDTPLFIQDRLRDWHATSPRLAALSSFGSGGTNAHVVVQEYPKNIRDDHRQEQYLFVLSAATQERLRAYVGRVIAWLEQEASSATFADAIFTWQVGRTAMQDRLAIRVTDHQDLLNKLKQWHSGKDVPDAWSGQVVQKSSSLNRVWQTKSGRLLIGQAVAAGDLELIGTLWASNIEIDWRKYYEREGSSERQPMIVSLPTYPFARDRYWIHRAENERANGKLSATAVLHPMLHHNTSDLNEQRFSTQFSGAEFFLSDHVVKGAKVLPAVCYLEMARVAVVASSTPTEGDAHVTFRLNDVIWMSPVMVDGPTHIHTAVHADEQGEIEYEVYSSAPGGAAGEDEAVVHGQGRASFSVRDLSAEDERLDWAALWAGRDWSVDAAHCYNAFSAMGIEYGPAHRGIRRLGVGRNAEDRRYVLAEVKLPDCVSETRDEYVLHPSVLDGALQASMGFSLPKPGSVQEAGSGSGAGRPSLPFALDEIEILDRTPAHAYVYVRESKDERRGEQPGGPATIQKLDIDICDANGRVHVRLKGFTSRVLDRDLETGTQRSATTREDESLISTVPLVPRWDAVIPAPGVRWPAEKSRILLVGGTAEQQQGVRTRYPDVSVVEPGAAASIDELVEQIHARGVIEHVVWLTPASEATDVTDERLLSEQSQGVLPGLRLIKALLRLGYGTRELGWSVVTWQTLAVARDELIRPSHASVHGLIGSLAKEYAHWKIRLADLPVEGEWPLAEVLSLPADEQGDAWAYRAGQWYRQYLLRYEPPAVQPSAFRPGGVYVVIGGAGGIGEAFSEHLIRNYRAQMIWIGRRELDADIQAKLDRLSALGPAPTYVRADATDRDALTTAYQSIKAQHSQIHGIVHAAIALLDKGLAQMDEARFETGLAAKADISVRMAQVFAHESMDFALFFSSLLSFAKPAGQSNYLAGCTFEDAFAHQLSKGWSCPVKIMNWGYWGSRGIVASAAYRARMAQDGIASIEPDEGMTALEQLLSAPIPQMALFKGQRRALVAMAVSQDRITMAGEQLPALVDHLSPRTDRRLPLERTTQHTGEMNDLQRLMGRLLLGQLRALGLFDEDHETTVAWKLKIGLPALYERWLGESVRILASEGYVNVVNGRCTLSDQTVPDLAALWYEWDTRKAEWLQTANLSAHVKLGDCTLRALPEILTGRLRATDVLFPNSSMELVEEIYKHNDVADHFNAVLADTVVEFVTARLSHDRGAGIRIIEIGAGTGGTSEGLFNRLKPHEDGIAEYCYTDVSKAFLMHAEETYGPTTRYLTYRLLNVEQALAPQGVDPGSYDLVIATNVLHATKNIRNAVRNAKALLKANGLLLVNELMGQNLFTHLTFGLLEGWWLYEDTPVRIPGTPTLAPEAWQRALEDEGFRNILFPAAASHAQGQQIIVAQSDGVIRQSAISEPVKIPRLQRQAATDRAGGGVSAVSEPGSPQPAIREASEDTDLQRLRDRATVALKKIVSESLKLPMHHIDPDEELEKYGIDSILVVRMVNALSRVFAGVSSTVFFEYRTIAALVDHFIAEDKEAVMGWVGVSEPLAGEAPESTDDSGRTSSPPALPARADRRRHRERRSSIVRSASVYERTEPGAARAHDSIAIVGLSGRYPEAVNLDAYWNNLREGKDCIVEIPRERWDWQAYAGGDSSDSGRHHSKWGGFIAGVDEFDPVFFNISPRDAKFIDPQERLFLQQAWLAVEDAGYTRASLQVSHEQDLAGQVGVYVGVMYSEYQLVGAGAGGQDLRMGFAGNLASIANRVSYVLNVHGPSMTLDTMCSSSLTAIHVACQDLKLGRTSLAIAGGVNVTIHPNKYLMLSVGQFISSDGRCQSFGARGDGFIPAEGVGVVVLKRLAEAERDGDHIYGIIRGSALNHGGKTNGYTVPNPQAQTSAISRALAESHTDPRHISYIEAHGTGTKLGDPIEIAALSTAFRRYTQDAEFCRIGSAKSNIGHCESAAGIAGLTKILLQMQHQQIVPSLHSEHLNPYIDFARSPFVVNQALRPWEQPVIDGRKLPRIAGISSFGAGGSNAHMIVEEYQAPSQPPMAVANVAILLSARTAEQLQQKASDLWEFVRPRLTTLDLVAMAYTLQVGREAMEERLAFVVSSVGQLAEKLQAYVAGEQEIEDAYYGQVKRNKEALSVFSTDADLQQTVDKWIANRRLFKLLDLWVKGLELDWSKLYGESRPQRISLPTYPFAKERYWIDLAASKKDPATGPATSVLHPLLHSNTSDLTEQSYRSTFTGEEFFIAEHQGKKVLPAVACLEMARAAIEHAMPARLESAVLELRNTVWAQPIIVSENMPVSIALLTVDSEQIDYEIYSHDADREIVHCQGRAVLSGEPAPARLDIERLKAQGQRLVHLRADNSGDYVLHPTLMDGALKAAVGSIDGSPFALERLRIVSPCAPEMVAWVRDSPGSQAEDDVVRLDIDLCDDRGDVAVQMRGLSWQRALLARVEPVIEEPEAPAAPVLMRKEIVFLAARSIAAPVERRKAATIALAAPGTSASSPASSTGRARIALSNASLSMPAPASAAPAVSPVRLYDCGNGIFSLEIAASRSKDIIAHVLQALEWVQQDVSSKVLMLGGIEHCFVRGGRDEFQEAVERKLFQRLVSFAYPVVALLHGDVIGAGFLGAALCDFMVCNEEARYGYTDAEHHFYPTTAETILFSERFGEVQAHDFLYGSMDSTGRQLRAEGWTCPILPWAQVEAHAQQLASTLATKSRDALRLLKEHLTRRMVDLVDALARVEVAKAATEEHPSAEPVLVIRYGKDGVRDQLADLPRCKAIVLVGEDPDIPDEVVIDLQRLLLESEIPAVAALTGNARGNAWLVSQFCDASVYSETGVYSSATIGQDLAQTAVAVFAHRFGSEAANEILLTGADYSGVDLRQRVGALSVAEHDRVLPTAVQLAESWAGMPRATLAAWKKQTATTLQDEIRNLRSVAGWEQKDETPFAAPEPIALQSRVVTLTVHPEGIVVVKMEDREAKNMFSDALVEGVREVFAHIEQTPAYKVVILTGYDSYFASGGTKENLLAIQEGKVKFTDLGIFHVALDCKLPVIAAMQGHGIGAGWSMGMFADIALLSDESRYVSPYMNYGFTPGAGATYILADKMGHDLARESLLTAHQYAGRELKERGLTLRVVPRVEVDATAMALAKQVARLSRGRLIGLKRQLTAHMRQALEETYRRELAMHEETFVGRSDTLAQIQSKFHHAAEMPPVGAQEVLVETPTAPEESLAEIAGPATPSGDGDPLRAVTASLRTLLSNELLMRESDIDDGALFVDLGLDSISGVTWIRKINEKYQTSLEATKVYSYPTLSQLSRYVKAEAETRGTLPSVGAAASADRPAASLKSTPSPQKSTTTPRKHFTTHKTGNLTSLRGRTAARFTSGPATRLAQPIAIIGMAGQFPQGKSLEEFWQNIAEGRNCITRILPKRWDLDTYYRPGDAVAGKTNCQWAGSLDEYDLFDPLFFNISPTEAENMDPQQRLFLQACWHSIENAGYDARALSGSRCGVFVGCTAGDYHRSSREHQLSAQGFTGSATSILAARISYFLNLQGPCVSIDTACSSSLVSIAQACDSLTSGASDLALAGGVYVMTGPEMHIKTAQVGMLSQDGRCFTFDQRANGFVPGEGVGVVLLKRLAEAQRDQDIIHAVIQGWGVNQDGKSNGITAPNPESQTRLEQEVYDKFQIDPANLQLIEAHGTGTKLGDPIEVEGLKKAFTKYTENKEYCALGSVKSNIGHCLTAAGVAGVLKLVLALKHKQLPPTINFEQLNEHIALKDSPFYVNSRLREWEPGAARVRQAAISALGFSGTNAHMVIGEYLPPAEVKRPVTVVSQDTKIIVPLSAKTAEQLAQKARDLSDFIRSEAPSIDLIEMAYTLQVGREAMDERLGVLVSSVEQLCEKLDAYVNGEPRIEDLHRGQAKSGTESTSIISQDDDVKDTIVEKWIAKRKLSKLLELWVNGLELDWSKLYGEVKPRRITLPTYPFAKERYWIDTASGEPNAARGASSTSPATAVLHPLLHCNTSDLSGQRYSTTFTGDEFFLTDHRVRTDGHVARKVLPGVAYLEMARAAIAQASPIQEEPSILELHGTVWLKPMVVSEPTQVSISLFADDAGRVAYEVYGMEGEHETVYCEGQALFSRDSAPARLDIEQLRGRMARDRWEGPDVYAMFTKMGLNYGWAHQGITSIALGENQLLAQLRLPAIVEASQHEYVLHPSLMDSALQASIGLIASNHVPTSPFVPFAVETLRIVSACTEEMLAWVRYSKSSKPDGDTVTVDIDLCDRQGNVCVQMLEFTLRVLDGEARSTHKGNASPALNRTETCDLGSSSPSDRSFYERLIVDVVNRKVSVDEAVEVG